MTEKFDPRCHIGETHGVYTIVDMLDNKDKYGHWIYKSVCNICGAEKFSHYGSISGPSSVTTKCVHTKLGGRSIVNSYSWSNDRIKNIFNAMVNRCYSEKSKDYRWYGGKGIQICDEWLDNPIKFEEWALSSGYSLDLTIDRIDAEKDYCPENCQWIPLVENSRKAGKVNWITVDGTTLTGRQWSEKLGLGLNTINTAIRECGIYKTQKLINAILHDPIKNHTRKSNQTWFSVYNIEL